jgi:SSS family solute:Na+ symporter
LFSAIFNEVLQFFLIWFGALLIPILGLIEAGGWKGLVARIQHNFPEQNFTHAWSTLGHFQDNPMGMHWTGIVFGLGAVISMGYWTTDFLVVQRVLAAKDLRSAKMAPIIGSFFKMAVPLIVILPGLIGLAVLPEKLVPESALQPGQHSYNDVLPLMLARYCGPGLMGLGVTALVAGFMAGMAGNVSAFATVWTYDIYRPFIRKTATDQHYVSMGRWCTIIGLFISIGTAYLAMGFASIMDYVQALFSFFIAPLFGTVLLGMLWKRATPLGGFLGLLAGTLTAIGIFLSMKIDHDLVAVFALSPMAKGLAQDMYQALWSCSVCVLVTVVASLATKPKPVAELTGLVYGVTPIPKEENVPLLHKPIFWAGLALVLFVILQIIFW